jgi:Reverse transcriptase (RNA-dependent DNA polymerase)
LVADGHLTATPIDSVYSGSLRIVVFLAELNDLKLHATDVSNAYLEAVTKERVYIIGGTGFGELEGHTLIIYKALYGLKSSGKRWHERLYDTLHDMGFKPSKANSDVWMRKNEDIYKYIAVYVDNLAIASRNPKKITDTLESKQVQTQTQRSGTNFLPSWV